ncbi:MAG: Zn-dependent peptidase [Rhodospirillaceae bacterium]|nr:MAG: Zn-dependent peptidase [Rhodospirillaceae bacterium]
MTITVTTLENGLRVATDFMEAIESVSLGAWVDVGARYESADHNGISHLLEHMAFKGTQRRSAFDIAVEIENVGGQINAYTSREHTAYYAKVLHEDMGLAVDIIADILQHSVFDPEELKREQQVIVQEISQAFDTPDDIIFDYFQAAAYPTQALGRPVLGRAEVVRAMGRETLAGFMRGNYSGERMVLAAAGRVDHEHLVALARDAFAELPPHRPGAMEAACYAGGDWREERDLEQVHVVLGFDGVSYDDPDFYAASVLSALLGGGMSSRLFQEVREKRGLAYTISSFTASYKDGGLLGVYAGTGEQEVAELIPVLCAELVKVTAEVTEAEIRRAQAQIRAGLLMALESGASRCEQLARQLLVYGRVMPVEEILARVEGVDGAAVTQLAKRILRTPLTCAALGPLERVESFGHIQDRLGI